MSIIKKKKQEKSHKSRCLICGSVQIHSELYKYKQIERTKLFGSAKRGSAISIKIEIPTCQNCKKKFHKWNLINLGSNLIYALGLVNVIIAIFFMFFYRFMGEIGLPLLGFGFLIIITGLILRYIIGKIRSNPSNYFFYDFLGKTFYIRPKKEEDWIQYKL